jgi:hypothetical protein
MLFSSKGLRQTTRRCNVPILGALVAAGKQDDECLASSNKVDAISRSAIDPQSIRISEMPSPTDFTSPGLPICSRSIRT